VIKAPGSEGSERTRQALADSVSGRNGWSSILMGRFWTFSLLATGILAGRGRYNRAL